MTLFGRILIFVLLLIGQWGGPPPLPAGDQSGYGTGSARAYLHLRLDRAIAAQPRPCRGNVLCNASLMYGFYEKRDFRPAWNTQGRLFENVTEFVAVLENGRADGLQPEDYHSVTINLLRGMLAQFGTDTSPLSPNELADLDLLLTDAFLSYGSHLLNGKIVPEEINKQWVSAKHNINLTAILELALSGHGTKAALAMLRSPQAGYLRMMSAWDSLHKLAENGGWTELHTELTLREGMRIPTVSALRRRLMITGDYNKPADTRDNVEEDDLFDDRLTDAVRFFQARHGLTPDGIVGRKTFTALNVPVTERLRQLELNMERWRWLPHDMGNRYLLVNIPDFSLKIIDNSRKIMEMRVVAGKPHRRTPVFSDMVEYLVVNPYWYLPETIIVEDMVPLILSDPEYFRKERIKVFTTGGGEQEELNPTAIDWTEISKDNLPYKLRQDYGPFNPLGRLKIVFPNQFSIYLHDTPSQGLFKKSYRDFSSGCIRLEKPVALAAYLLKGDPAWSREQIIAAMNSGERRVITLAEPIPIHIVYMTAWADEQGVIQFRKDTYRWDRLLEDTLSGKLPETDPACVDMDKI